MKRIALIRACVLIAIAAGTLAVQASYAHGSSMSPLLAMETEALTRQGISTERATQAIQVESELAQTNLIAKLEAALGAAYAGVWFEPATAQLHVGVTSPTARRTAAATTAEAGLSSQVVETPVASTWAQLLATENHWSARLANSGPIMLALAPQLNAVIVTLSSTIPTTQLTALEHEAATSTVAVHISVEPPQQIEPTTDRTGQCKAFVTKVANCEKPIASGVTITSLFRGGGCTSGPLAIGKGLESNKTYVLTAGHCIVEIEPLIEVFAASTPSGALGTIGPATAKLAGNGQVGDYGSIEVRSPPVGEWVQAGNPPVFALTAEWKLTGGSTVSYPVKGERTPAVGLTNCHEGQTTGQSCGQIKALNVLANYTKGLKVAGLVADTGANNDEGDSGGPWMFIESNNEVLMEGIHSGGFTGNGTKTFYTPLQTALKALKLDLLTTANEVRKGFVTKNPPVKIRGTNKGLNVFEPGGGGTVECESVSSTATAAETIVQALDNTIKYANCFAKFGIIKSTAEVSTAEALFEISGSLSIESKIIIKAAEKCEIIIPPTGNRELSTVTYTNTEKSPKEVEVKIAAGGITQETKGPSETCGKSGKEGKYKGVMIAKAEEGDIEVS
jgi:hypothetical protein